MHGQTFLRLPLLRGGDFASVRFAVRAAPVKRGWAGFKASALEVVASVAVRAEHQRFSVRLPTAGFAASLKSDRQVINSKAFHVEVDRT